MRIWVYIDGAFGVSEGRCCCFGVGFIRGRWKNCQRYLFACHGALMLRWELRMRSVGRV